MGKHYTQTEALNKKPIKEANFIRYIDVQKGKTL